HSGHEAEDQDVDGQPRAPHQVGGAAEVRTRGMPAGPESDAEAESGERQEPGVLATELSIEQPEQAGRTAEATAATTTAAGPAAGAKDAAETVIAEDQVERRAVGRAADEGSGRGRQELHDQDPPAACDDRRGAGDGKAEDPVADTTGCGDRPDDGKR